MKQSRLPQVITCGVFLCCVAGLSAAALLTPAKSFSERENRILAQVPKLTMESIANGTFTQDWDSYVTDQFFARDHWISVKTAAELALGKRESNCVYFAEDGYFIEKHTEAALDREQLEKNTTRLAAFVEKYTARLGTERVRVLIAPTAGEILAEKLPAFAPNLDQSALLANIQKALPADCWVNAEEALREAAEKEQVYYRTDHHWTTQGAFAAYDAWARSCGMEPWVREAFDETVMSDGFLGTTYAKVNLKTQPDTITAFLAPEQAYTVTYNLGERTTDTLYDLDKLNTSDPYAVFLGGNQAVVQIKNEQVSGRNLLILKDSYAHCFAPFVCNHYENTFLLDLRYYNGGIADFVEQNGITDILVLYNAVNFAEDKNLSPLSR